MRCEDLENNIIERNIYLKIVKVNISMSEWLEIDCISCINDGATVSIATMLLSVEVVIPITPYFEVRDFSEKFVTLQARVGSG